MNIVINKYFVTIPFSRNVLLSFVMMVLFLAPTSSRSHDEFVDVIAAVKPSIVTIEANRKSSLFKSKEERQRDKALGEYKDFFKGDFNEIPRKRFGSGFVIASTQDESWVITAAHVVVRSSRVEVALTNGKKIRAKLEHINRQSDVALLRLPHGGLPVLSLSAESLYEGQSVLGIGAAFALPVSSSVGIVSALDVYLSGFSGLGLVQTDVSVNPGSSGGALINSSGQVVGLISKIYSKTGTFSGSSFAVPVSRINELLDQWLASN